MPRHSKHSNCSKQHSVDPVESDGSTLAESIEVNHTFQWDGNTQGLLGIAHGSAGMIFALDEFNVVKVYLGRESRSIENLETERQAYRNLKQGEIYCEHVLRCYDLENQYGIVLERCRETVRQRIKSPEYSPRAEALNLAIQAAKGLSHIHYCGIRQGDGSTHCRRLV
jgi:hypothetical protein